MSTTMVIKEGMSTTMVIGEECADMQPHDNDTNADSELLPKRRTFTLVERLEVIQAYKEERAVGVRGCRKRVQARFPRVKPKTIDSIIKYKKGDMLERIVKGEQPSTPNRDANGQLRRYAYRVTIDPERRKRIYVPRPNSKGEVTPNRSRHEFIINMC